MVLPEKLTITWLRQAYLRGETTPAEVIRECLSRCEKAQSYNIWIHRFSWEEIAPYLQALEQKPMEECPLWGIPFAIKDNIDLAGMETTAACPGYAYLPRENAEVVQRVLDAGAIPLGKTNMDQFATGLVGTRSPYGETHNSLRPELISGGSSSGSAVAVALGQAAFSFGTDTAGSGRVPAALNGLYGWKPSLGAYPKQGVVPACESIDCVSVFANTLEDAVAVDASLRGLSRQDPWSQEVPFGGKAMPKRIFLPNLTEKDFYGPFAAQYQSAWQRAVAQMETLGIPVTRIDDTMFREAASILYGGPLVAERWSALGDFVEQHPDSVFPVTLEILKSGAGDCYTASQLFQAQHKLKAYGMKTRQLLQDAVYVTPTCGGTWSRADVRANPIGANTDMGRFTNHCNLLDLCAAAVPAGMADDKLPFGITVFGLHGMESLLEGFAERFASRAQSIPLVVCGLHMRGMPLEHELTDCGAVFDREVTTAPLYKLYDLSGPLHRPGMVQAEQGGASLEAELWQIPADQFGPFASRIGAPLGFGKIKLSDGTAAEGFLCEAACVTPEQEITPYRSYRNYRNALPQ